MAYSLSLVWTALSVYFTVTLPTTGSQLRTIICPNTCECYKDKIFCDAAGLLRIPTILPLRTKILDLRQNNISRINNEFWDLTQLETLDISYNNLSTVHIDAFMNNRYLKELQLEENRLTSIVFKPDLWGLSEELRSLNVANNNLGPELSAGMFRRLISLQMLDLSGNGITTLPEDTFAGLVSLNHLVLKSNEMTHVPTMALSGGSGVLSNTLQILELSQNPIEIMDSQSFPSNKGFILSKLDVLLLNSMEGLFDVQDETFVQLPSLRVIEITACPLLHHISGSAFKGLEQIEFVYLNDNHLQHLKEEMLEWHRIEENGVRLYGNPWYCDCHIKWIISDVVMSTLDKKQLLVCSEPNQLKGQHLLSLSPMDLVCEPDHKNLEQHNHLLYSSKSHHQHTDEGKWHPSGNYQKDYEHQLFPKVFAVVVPIFVCSSLFFLLLAAYCKRMQKGDKREWLLRSLSYGSLHRDNYGYRHSALDLQRDTQDNCLLTATSAAAAASSSSAAAASHRHHHSDVDINRESYYSRCYTSGIDGVDEERKKGGEPNELDMPSSSSEALMKKESKDS